MLENQAAAYCTRATEVPLALTTCAPVFPTKTAVFLRIQNIITACDIAESLSNWSCVLLTHRQVYQDLGVLQVVCNAPDNQNMKIVSTFNAFDAVAAFTSTNS